MTDATDLFFTFVIGMFVLWAVCAIIDTGFTVLGTIIDSINDKIINKLSKNKYLGKYTDVLTLTAIGCIPVIGVVIYCLVTM